MTKNIHLISSIVNVSMGALRKIVFRLENNCAIRSSTQIFYPEMSSISIQECGDRR